MTGDRLFLVGSPLHRVVVWRRGNSGKVLLARRIITLLILHSDNFDAAMVPSEYYGFSELEDVVFQGPSRSLQMGVRVCELFRPMLCPVCVCYDEYELGEKIFTRCR